MKKEGHYLQEIIDYINKNMKKGYTRESLKWALVKQGHSRNEIEKAFDIVDQEMAKNAPVLNSKPKITYEVVEPKDITYKSSEEKKPFWKKWF